MPPPIPVLGQDVVTQETARQGSRAPCSLLRCYCLALAGFLEEEL